MTTCLFWSRGVTPDTNQKTQTCAPEPSSPAPAQTPPGGVAACISNLYPSSLCLCCFLCVFARVDAIASLHVFALLVNEMWSSVDATCGMSGFALNNHELHGASQPGSQTRKLKDVAQQVPTASNAQQQCNCFAALLGLEERTKKTGLWLGRAGCSKNTGTASKHHHPAC